MKWVITGRKWRQHKWENPQEEVIDIIEAESFDDAIDIADKKYGIEYYVGAVPSEENND